MRGLRGLGERREARTEGYYGSREGGCLTRWERMGMAFSLLNWEWDRGHFEASLCNLG